ncbi:sensor domain-containing diguanylate cyclase [Desulfoplanes sp.]
MRETEDTSRMEPRVFHIFRDFLLRFIPIVLFAMLLVVVGLGSLRYMRTERIKLRERNLIEQERRVIQTDLVAHASDALLVADVIRSGRSHFLDEIVGRTVFTEFLVAMSRAKHAYDQVRLLDEYGREIVRVNRGYTHAASKEEMSSYVVARKDLQDKSSRPYFTKAIGAEYGDVIVSRFDLNIEHGWVERPIKPMIRFSTPVDDRQGKRMGVVVLNYLGKKLIEMVKGIAGSTDGDIYLINADGYWLIGPSPEDEWGFVLGKGNFGHVRDRFPVLWEHVMHKTKEQFVDGSNLFTFTTMAPTSGTGEPDTVYPRIKETEHWILVSRVPLDVLGREETLIGLLGGLAIFFGLGLVAWMWTLARYKSHQAELSLFRMATTDGLTGLFNRRYFVDCVEKEIERSRRYERSLSMILFDIDHFKRINDTYGHEKGDQVLRNLARCVRRACREQDVLGRVGGEEFAVLLPETGREQAVAMAERLRQSVECERVTVGEGEVIHFSISVGVTSKNRENQGMDFQTLFTRADALMYRAKESGRNRVVAG